MMVLRRSFAAQLDWLARNDYRVLRLSQLARFLAGKKPLPQRSVVITIDDGYESVYRHALPAAAQVRLPGHAVRLHRLHRRARRAELGAVAGAGAHRAWSTSRRTPSRIAT